MTPINSFDMSLSKNTGLIHSECATERHKAFQESLGDKIIPLGGYVKIKFTEAEGSEHMWVILTSNADPEEYKGVLDNEPRILGQVKCGDTVTFKRSDIEAIF